MKLEQKRRVIQARRLAEASHRQTAAAITTLDLLEQGGRINPTLLANLIGDVSANLRSAIRTATEALNALEAER